MSNESVVQEWNELYPPGTSVLLTNDDGHIEETKTRSIGWLLGSGTPVVSVEGRTGGYLLKRIRPFKRIDLEEGVVEKNWQSAGAWLHRNDPVK